MKENVLKLLEFDSNTACKKYSHMPLTNNNVLVIIENTRKYARVEAEFTLEEFEFVKKLFDLKCDEQSSFIGKDSSILSKEELEKLGGMTILQLAQDLENGLINASTLSGELSVAEYLKHYFIPAQAVPKDSAAVGGKKWFKVDFYHDSEYKRYAYTDIVGADCVENIVISPTWLSYKIEEDVVLEYPELFSASITHDYSDGYDCDHHDYIKTIYVQATSFKEGKAKLTEKYKKFKGAGSEYSLGRVYKHSQSPLDILLSE